MSKDNALPPVSSLDLLRSLYSELAAPFVPYFTTILKISWMDESPDTEEAITHETEEIPEHKIRREDRHGAKSVIPVRQFAEETCGSLYAPVSALGYRNFNYEWALLFKIDCDLARKKTGDIMDGAAHYISDVAADDKIVRRRAILNNRTGGYAAKSNSKDLEERYLTKMKNLSATERKEISVWLRKNKKKLDKDESFYHEDFEPRTSKNAVSISSGPENLSDEAFLSWLVSSTDGKRVSRKPQLDEIITGYTPNGRERKTE